MKLLVVFALASLAAASSPPIVEGKSCRYNMMVVEDGQTISNDHNNKDGVSSCSDCTCNDGKLECQDVPCCLYIDDGEQKRAAPGDDFNDGCNQCQCGDDGMKGCTKMACPNKCNYKNWSLVEGYAKKKAKSVAVYSEKHDCPMLCDCKRKMKCGKSASACIHF